MRKLAGISLTTLMLFAGGCDGEKETEEQAAEACPGDAARDANGECLPPLLPGVQPQDNGGGGGDGMLPGMDGGDDGSDSGDGGVVYEPDPTVGVSIPGLGRNIFVSDEVAARTVHIVSFNGDKMECSSDGGVTFAKCLSQSEFVWNVADYNVKHVIRATETKDGKTRSVTAEFTPSEEFPDMKFVDCDVTVSDSSNFSDFANAAGLAGSNVVCIEDGVTIAPDMTDYMTSTTMQLQSDGMVFIARAGDNVTFTTDAGLIFDTNGYDDAMFVGLTLRDTTGRSVVTVKNLAADRSLNVRFDDVHVACNGNQTGHCIQVQSSGSSTEPVRITNSFMERDNDGNGAPVFLNGSTVVIGHSTLKGAYNAVIAYFGSTAALHHSTAITTRASSGPGVLYAYRDSNLILDSSVVESSGDYAVYLGSFNDTVGVGTVMQTSNSMFKRNDTDAGGDLAVFYLQDGTIDPVVDSDSNGNLFCNVALDSVAGDFISIFAASGAANGGNFAAPLQENGGSIGTCP